MHGKNAKLASAALSALLFTQGLLGFAAVTLVVAKERLRAEPAIVTAAVAAPAQVR